MFFNQDKTLLLFQNAITDLCSNIILFESYLSPVIRPDPRSPIFRSKINSNRANLRLHPPPPQVKILAESLLKFTTFYLLEGGVVCTTLLAGILDLLQNLLFY